MELAGSQELEKPKNGIMPEIPPEKEEAFRALLEELSHPFSDASWDAFKEHWDEVDSTEVLQNLLHERKTWIAAHEAGEPLVSFLKNEIQKNLAEGKSHDVYTALCVYLSLSSSDSEQAPFLIELLDHKVVWANSDGSSKALILKALKNHVGTETADAIVRYIGRMFDPEYKRVGMRSYELPSAIGLLYKAKDKETVKILEMLAEANEGLRSWLTKNDFFEELVKNDDESLKDNVRFDLITEQAHLEELEVDLAAKQEDPSLLPESYDWYFSKQKKSYKEKDPWGVDMHTEPELPDWEGGTRYTGALERERNPEKEKTPVLDRIIIRGSVAFALKTGRDVQLARDIDIFFVYRGNKPGFAIKDLKSIDEGAQEFSPETLERLRAFTEAYGLQERSIHLVRVSEGALQEMSLFDDEPEILLWQPQMELKSKLLKPVSVEEKLTIEKELNEARLPYDERVSLRDQILKAHELHLYKEGKLIRGKVPGYLTPRTGSLASVLRLVDLGERFGVPVDDAYLEGANRCVANKDMQLRIPPERKNTTDSAISEEEDDLGGGSRSFDVIFYNVATRKPVQELIQKRYPSLAAFVERVREAGGIRKFVKEEYGDVYLERGRPSIPLNALSFKETSLPMEDQKNVISFWENAPASFREIFQENPQRLLAVYEERAKEGSLAGKAKRDLYAEVVKSEVAPSLASEDPARRRLGYKCLEQQALTYQSEGRAGAESYQMTKELMREKLFAEKNKPLRKVLAQCFVNLSQSGQDLSIAHDFAGYVHKEHLALKSRHGEKKRILTPEGIAVLRGLFKLRNKDGDRAINELISNPEIDPRLKKACLKNLVNRDIGSSFPNGVFEHAREDIRLGAHKIPWEDYGAWNRVARIASSTVRERIQPVAESAFSSIRYAGKKVHELNKEITPDLLPEFFLPLYKIFQGNAKQIETWAKLISAIKSSKLRDSFLYNISNLASYDRRTLELITEQVVSSEQRTKEHALLVDRLLKKMHFLTTLKTTFRGSVYDHASGCGCLQCSKKKTATKGKLSALSGASMEKLLEETGAPSILEAKLDTMIVEGLHEITGRVDLTADKIQTLFRAWEDPEPIFLFMAGLAKNVSIADEAQDHNYKSLRLTGEMLAHMDPPNFQEWKQWRYHSDDPVLKEQLKGLTPQQVEAWAQDDFVELGEVLVGLLPSDKPKRIQEALIHGMNHTAEAAHTDAKHTPITNLTTLVRTDFEKGPLSNFETASQEDLRMLDEHESRVDTWLRLEEDMRIFDYLPRVLDRWQKTEARKREELGGLGYGNEASRADIERDIAALRKSGKDTNRLNRLASLKLTDVPEKIQKFLQRYNLMTRSSTSEISSVAEAMQKQWKELTSSPEFAALCTQLLENKEVSRPEFQNLKRDMKAARTLLQMGRLTPQLIAFNRIIPGKKKATLQASINFLKEYFQDQEEMASSLGRIEDIVKEESHPVGKDRLAIIFTDNPLVFLTIGKFPQGAASCQHYENGDEVLAAYMADGYTKACILVDLDKLPTEIQESLENAQTSEEKLKVFQNDTHAFLNAEVARRLTKKVDNAKSGKPELFLEPVYTPLDRASTTRMLNAYAVTHLRPRIGIDLVRGGGIGEVKVAASRNGRQYEDGESGGPGGGGAGIGTQTGSYKMSAQPIRESDYQIAGLDEGIKKRRTAAA